MSKIIKKYVDTDLFPVSTGKVEISFKFFEDK
jgi:hypothetical protein